MRRSRSAALVMSRATVAAVALFLLLILASSGRAQHQNGGRRSSSAVPTGWELSGVPALNYDADEGFGYGAIVELYRYAPGAQPYRFTLQPTLFLTTEGRRDLTVFFDAPSFLPGGWRVSAFAGREQQLAQPYYGIGNATVFDEAAESGPNPYYYRFGRTRLRGTADFQHRIGGSAARILVGGGLVRTTVNLTPFDSGTTLLAADLGGRTPSPDRVNYLRAGLVWDTRDREIGPNSGTWAELIVQRVSKAFGATEDFTRWTATVRQYLPLSSKVVFAQRILAQGIEGNAPFHELSTMQSSFKQQDGLGGSGSARGLPKDRYVGKGTMLSNSELRWRATDFSLHGRPSYLALSTFVDAGRVWADRFDPSTSLRDLHAGYGGGVRLGYGQSFVVAVDIGHSNQSTAPVYIGLGWMF